MTHLQEPAARIDTRAVHAGESPRIAGSVITPIFQTTMFETLEDTAYHDFGYLRLNNSPNHDAVHRKLAALEGGEAALVAASGMAAISTCLLTVLAPGGHLLAQRALYGGTHDLLTVEFPRLGLGHDFIDAARPETWAAALRPDTRAIYLETMTNPTLEVGDLAAAAAFAKAHGLLAIIDNTFASPVNFRPLEHGFDIVLHSCTKYLNGHSDLVAGAVIGRAELVEAVRTRLNIFGGTLDPHACFLLQRGMKTLAVRVRQQNANALTVASYLQAHPKVKAVHYPGLASHPAHARARTLFDGFGGMLAVSLHGGIEAAERCIAALQLVVHTVSLGGVESLVTMPARSTHSSLSDAERDERGIDSGLMRISIGIEAADDLVADFAQALAHA
jgi:cystathionine gamma-synthase/cystathionine gamma-lyase/cystathionine beta-lyase